MLELHEILALLVRLEGSDLHLKVNSRPLGRINGTLGPLEEYEVLTPEDTEAIVPQMLANQPEKLAEFEADGEVDFAYSVSGLARFRVNAFRQRGTVSIVARVIPFAVRTATELGLPAVIAELADEERGLILLTGTTGSGKSTTLAAMIAHINENKARHIVTIEDPIEYLHSDRKSIINQREVGMDTASFARAMRRVLRQDPDVILIGEMRDEETVRTALSAAETGHLVLSTVHTLDASESVNRIIDFFQPHEQDQARAMLAGTLRGVVSQRLVPTIDGQSRVAVCEILRMTGRARDMIMDPEQTGRLPEVITEGSYYGMQTFDQALLGFYQAGRVSLEDALRVSTSPHDLKLLIAAEGRTATSMDDLIDRTGNGNGNGNGHHPPSAPPSHEPEGELMDAPPVTAPPAGAQAMTEPAGPPPPMTEPAGPPPPVTVPAAAMPSEAASPTPPSGGRSTPPPGLL
jgi:twitching motility protein PilT